MLFRCKAALLLRVNSNHGGHDPSTLPCHPILTQGKYHEVIIGFHMIPFDKIKQSTFRFCINDTIMTISMDFEIDARLHGVYGLLFYTSSDFITPCSKTPSDEFLISPEGVFYLRKTRIYRADHRFLFYQRLFNSPFAVKHSRAGQKHDIIIVDK